MQREVVICAILVLVGLSVIVGCAIWLLWEPDPGPPPDRANYDAEMDRVIKARRENMLGGFFGGALVSAAHSPEGVPATLPMWPPVEPPR